MINKVVENSLCSNTLVLEAQNENTSPQRLTEIYNNSQESDSAVKQALTANPNTPLDILIRLAESYPVEFLENPALDLHLLANTNLLAEIPETSYLSLLKTFNVPQSFILLALT